jgi:hypothetical protein
MMRGMVIGRIIKSGKGRRPCLCPRFGKLGLLKRVSSRITKNDVSFVSVEMNGGRDVDDRDFVRKDACNQRRCDFTLALPAVHGSTTTLSMQPNGMALLLVLVACTSAFFPSPFSLMQHSSVPMKRLL